MHALQKLFHKEKAIMIPKAGGKIEHFRFKNFKVCQVDKQTNFLMKYYFLEPSMTELSYT